MLFKRFRIIKTTRTPPKWLNPFSWITFGIVFACSLLFLFLLGYQITFPGFVPAIIIILLIIATFTTIIEVAVKRLLVPQTPAGKFRYFFDLLIALLLILLLIISPYWVLPILILYQLINTFPKIFGSGIGNTILGGIHHRPVRMLVISFLTLITIGTILLTFPAATTDRKGASFLTALFTATSATCVTGLIVKDTATYFSRFGQVVILVLIQLGGLGIMTFYSSLVVLMGQRLGLSGRRTMQEIIEETRGVDIARLIRYIFLFTTLVELLGAGVLFIRWLPLFPHPLQTLYFALFHSVSAFCNAGFALFSDSFIRFQSDLITNLCIISLIIIGGLGFPVINEIFNRETISHHPRNLIRRLTVHTRLVLWATTMLIIGGTILFFFIEYDNALASLSLGGKLLASLFQSVTARTAGFNTVATSILKPITIFLWSVLMFIGASPGGTGGGVKTSTVAVLFLAVRSRLRGEEEITLARRFITKEIVYRASAIIALGLTAITLSFSILLYTQPGKFEALLFETVSAFGTVGLSTGITPNLNAIGKIVIIVLMFIGRIGPLTLTLAMTAHREHSSITYPSARVIVG